MNSDMLTIRILINQKKEYTHKFGYVNNSDFNPIHVIRYHLGIAWARLRAHRSRAG